MAQIICPKCEHSFDSNSTESFVTRAAAAAAGAAIGGMFAGVLDIVGGGTVGWFGANQFRRCPSCRKIFKI